MGCFCFLKMFEIVFSKKNMAIPGKLSFRESNAAQSL